MNITGIQYFITTAEEMNFTRAAMKLNISQQALSGHIKRLEEEYNASFFQRKPVLRLTKAGEEFLYYGRRILLDEQQLSSRLFDINQNRKAKLRIGTSRIRARAFFAPIWSLFHQEYPNISIELIDGNTAKQLENLSTGKIDLFIGVDVPNDPNLETVELASEQLQCCMTSSLLKEYYPDTFTDIIKSSSHGLELMSISKLPLLALRPGNKLRSAIDQYFGANYKPDYLFECDEQEIIYELAANNSGAGIVSPVVLYMHRNELPENFLSFPMSQVIPPAKVSLAYRKDYIPPKYMMQFIQCSSVVYRTYSKSFTAKKQ